MKQENKFNIKTSLDEGFWFLDIEDIFMTFKKSTLDFYNQKKRRIFIDNGGEILFVAHLDTVLPPKVKMKTENKIFAQGLDDRLGASIAYNLSRMLGADLLLCDNEEKGASTAQYQELKDYLWIAEFVRDWHDVVTYDIDSDDFLDKLRFFFPIGWGSFSDICILDTTACCVNIGIGYKKAHMANSFVDLDVCNVMIGAFIDFYTMYKHTRFTAEYNYNYKRHQYDMDHSVWLCEICEIEYGDDCWGYNICKNCFDCMLQYAGWGVKRDRGSGSLTSTDQPDSYNVSADGRFF